MAVNRDLVGRYLCRVLVEASSLRQDSSFGDDIASQLNEFGLARIPVEQVQVVGSGSVPFFLALGAKGLTTLSVEDNVFSFTFDGLAAHHVGEGAPTLATFIEDAAQVLAVPLSTGERRGHRLAFVVEDFATDREERQTSVNDVADRLLKIPDGWGPSGLTAWEWKYSMRRNNGDEDYNLLAQVQSANGDVRGNAFKGIWFKFEANTAPDNARGRFGADELLTGFAPLADHVEWLKEQVDGMIGDF